jgi:hypothetical protein
MDELPTIPGWEGLLVSAGYAPQLQGICGIASPNNSNPKKRAKHGSEGLLSAPGRKRARIWRGFSAALFPMAIQSCSQVIHSGFWWMWLMPR